MLAATSDEPPGTGRPTYVSPQELNSYRRPRPACGTRKLWVPPRFDL